MNKFHYFFLLGCTIFAAHSFAATSSSFTLTSPALKPNQVVNTAQLLDHYGCEGQNISPALTWSHAPVGTKSFALTFYDQDAPAGWWHWVVFNIPASVQQLPANAGNPTAKLLPAGALQINNSFGMMGYGGPCPPKGNKPHQYVMTLYALKTNAPLTNNASANDVNAFIKQNTLAAVAITVHYQR